MPTGRDTRHSNIRDNLRTFLRHNGISGGDVEFELAPSLDQELPFSSGWLLLESARAYLREGLRLWVDSSLYAAFSRNTDKEYAAIENWEVWAAVPWRGTKQFVPSAAQGDNRTPSSGSSGSPMSISNEDEVNGEGQNRLFAEVQAAGVLPQNQSTLIYFIEHFNASYPEHRGQVTVREFHDVMVNNNRNIPDATAAVLQLISNI